MVRDRREFAFNKALVEQMWREYEPICPDRHFLEDAKSHFHARTWEMYLAHVLRADRFALERPPSTAPDIRFRWRRRLVYVEAIAAERGEGPDAVPLSPVGVVFHPATERILLRLTAAVKEKMTKYEAYRTTGEVGQDDPYVVAVNAYMVPEAGMDQDPIPEIVKALMPIGDAAFSIPVSLDGKEPPRRKASLVFPFRRSLLKQSGASVPTDSFMNPAYGGLSGVLFSIRSIWWLPEHLGDELLFFHNPNAATPLPKGMFTFGRECWIDLKAEHFVIRDRRSRGLMRVFRRSARTITSAVARLGLRAY
jgi:hypothetical protein